MKWHLEQPKTRIKCVVDKPGESIEEKLRRSLAAGEPVDAIAPLQYTDRADGPLAQFDHRADPLEMAQDAAHKYYQSRKDGFAKREKALAEQKAAEEAIIKAAATQAAQNTTNAMEGA